MDELTRKKILQSQKEELTEYSIYNQLAGLIKDADNRRVLGSIAKEEMVHHDFWKNLSGQSVTADQLKILFYVGLSRILGITFGLKLMERGENSVRGFYETMKLVSPGVEKILSDEKKHEQQLLELLDEERLRYAGSVVLGLNDALVELTGALAGLTLALNNPKLIAMVGSITGIAASMSMAAAEYLSTKQEPGKKNPLKACTYTGIAYTLTVLFLISPYLVFKNVYLCLGLVMLFALSVILAFTFYISVAKGFSFKKRFIEMAGISLSIAAINFFIGMAIRKFFGVSA